MTYCRFLEPVLIVAPALTSPVPLPCLSRASLGVEGGLVFHVEHSLLLSSAASFLRRGRPDVRLADDRQAASRGVNEGERAQPDERRRQRDWNGRA